MDHEIKIKNWGRVFTVPCSVADDHLKNTDGNYLKVLLCVLSWGGGKFSTEKISRLTGLETSVVSDALMFWNDKEVISVSGAKDFTGFVPDKQVTEQVKAVEMPKAAADRSENVAYTPAEIASLISSDGELKNFFDSVQKVLKRTLNYTEQRGFIYIYEFYSYSAPAMLLIAEYCEKLGKSSISYIKTVAKSFFEQDIISYADIEKHIIALEEAHSYENRIASAFGIKIKLTSSQKKYIEQWKSMDISPELAEYAYDLCADNTGKLSFSYINKILDNWKKNGITTPEQAKNERLAFSDGKRSGSKGKKSSYDVDEIDEFQKNYLLKQN